jgi:hypothetical protein
MESALVVLSVSAGNAGLPFLSAMSVLRATSDESLPDYLDNGLQFNKQFTFLNMFMLVRKR